MVDTYRLDSDDETILLFSRKLAIPELVYWGPSLPPGTSGSAGAKNQLGRSYFEACIRPDRHSLELLRGFKSLAEKSIDFFATVSWREEAGTRKHFLIVATPCDSYSWASS